MGVSRSTLYRRLKGEGTTFAAIYDDLRKRMAIDYLQQKVEKNRLPYRMFVRAFMVGGNGLEPLTLSV
jgi:AraC-like DNA-binding protein